MRQGEIWDAEAARRYDTPGTGMFAPEVLDPVVDRLAKLAGGGRALEFAIGTGRVAVPLVELGVDVTGIKLSRPMIDMAAPGDSCSKRCVAKLQLQTTASAEAAARQATHVRRTVAEERLAHEEAELEPLYAARRATPPSKG